MEWNDSGAAFIYNVLTQNAILDKNSPLNMLSIKSEFMYIPIFMFTVCSLFDFAVAIYQSLIHVPVKKPEHMSKYIGRIKTKW